MTKPWKTKVCSIESCDLKYIEHIIAIDETGTPTLKNIDENTLSNKSWFGVTGIIFDTTTVNQCAKSITNLKNKFWESGMYDDKRVVFHSRDIRKRNGPFNPKLIEYDYFRSELNKLISDLPFQFVSSLINKKEHVMKYLYPNPTYILALEFIFERLVRRLNWLHENCVIFLESRGKREDEELLYQIVSILENGTRYVPAEDLKCITGVYFEKKRTENKEKSYWPLEIADLISYRVFSAKTQKKNLFNFAEIESKFINYPNYNHKGLKIFP